MKACGYHRGERWRRHGAARRRGVRDAGRGSELRLGSAWFAEGHGGDQFSILTACAERKCTRPCGAAPAGAPPAGGHASPHLCTRPQRGAVAPSGAPRSQAARGAARPGQAPQDELG